MIGYYVKFNLKSVDTVRDVIIPSNITFEVLHHIIRILYAFDDEHGYKFTFPNLSLVIRSYSINPDVITATREKIDKYFEALDSITYIYNRLEVKITVNDVVNYDKHYPQLLSIHNKYIEDFDFCLDDLNDNVKIVRTTAISRALNKIQINLMMFFMIPYKLDDNRVVEVVIDENYSLDKYLL